MPELLFIVKGRVFSHRDRDFRVLVKGKILQHIRFIVESSFSQGDDIVFGVAVVDEGCQSTPSGVKARVVGEVFCSFSSATAAHQFGPDLLFQMKSELQFLIDYVQIEDGGTGVFILLKINDLFQLTQPIVSIATNNLHCFFQLNPQNSLLTVRMK